MEYTIKLKQEELVILSKALGKLPFEVVSFLILKIQKQIVEQEDVTNPSI